MNTLDSIIHHGKINAKACYPLSEEDVKKNLPYFEVYKNSTGRYDIRSYNYEKHDNAPRMQYYETYFKNSIFPNVDKAANITGFYNIELHDSYTYLENEKDYRNCLVFSKFKDDVGPILIPDPYQVGGYGTSLRLEDKIPWDKKRDCVSFYGTTTGHRDPLKNQRLNLCMWSLGQNRSRYNFNITNVAQMTMESVRQKYPQFDSFYKPQGCSTQEQLNDKFMLHVDGNTSRFDVWSFKTNSVVLKYKSRDMLWYYDMLLDKTHFREVDVNTMDATVNQLLSSPVECQIMSVNAKRFVMEILRPITHQIYTTSLFDTIGTNK